MSIKVKICGIKTIEIAQEAAQYGAEFLGFMFYDKSPRHLTLKEASALRPLLPPAPNKVAVTVDANDEYLQSVIDAIEPDYLQLHGHETPERCLHIRQKFALPVIKAIGVSTQEDVQRAADYHICDMLLFDAKPIGGMTGGNGVAFDWNLIKNMQHNAPPWMLSGGLNTQNVAQAVRESDAQALDVSSGVESSRGNKSAEMIREFMQIVKGIEL